MNVIKDKNRLISLKYLTILNPFSHKIIKVEYHINKGKFECIQFAIAWLKRNEFVNNI